MTAPPPARHVLSLPVIRLQVQVRPMKQGRAPWRVYDPSCLREVDRLRLTQYGVVGVLDDGTEILDVHHADHPESRDRRGRSGLSVMATGDYAALRERYGDHLTDGIAGEGILVEHRPGLGRRAMPEHMLLRRAGDPGDGAGGERGDASGDGAAELALHGVHVAEPCVEFTRYCLRLPASDSVGDDVAAGLLDLGDGARGYKMVAGGEWVLRRGDLLVLDVRG
jgi:hypothetical protein